MLDRAPVAAVEAVAADHVAARPRWAGLPRLAMTSRQLLAHALGDQREGLAVEIGPPPLARARVHVEGVERVPVRLGDVAAVDPLDGDAGRSRLLALLAHGLALARGERGEEVVEVRVAGVVPVELLVRALQEPVLAQPAPLALAQEGDVHARHAVALGTAVAAAAASSASSPPPRARPHQQAAPRHRREGHGDLQLGIVAAAGALVGIGPGVVEDVLALAVRFGVAGRAGDDLVLLVLQDEVARRPARAVADAARFLQRLQEAVGEERIEDGGVGIGAGVPRLRPRYRRSAARLLPALRAPCSLLSALGVRTVSASTTNAGNG